MLSSHDIIFVTRVKKKKCKYLDKVASQKKKKFLILSKKEKKKVFWPFQLNKELTMLVKTFNIIEQSFLAFEGIS